MAAEDEELVKETGMDPLVAKALRHRRQSLYANEITGPVHEGKLSNWLVLAYV